VFSLPLTLTREFDIMQNPMLNIAVMAARKAGDIINHATLDLELIKVTHKGFGEYVSDIDHIAEKTIVELLLNAYPSHTILAKENTGNFTDSNSRYQWVIDPINGTTNFIHGLPHFAVSIALQVNGVTEQAVIYAPATNQLFTASKGLGGFCNNRRMRVSKRTRLLDALLGSSIAVKAATKSRNLDHLMLDLMADTAGVRHLGSPVLDLAYVASGALDACYAIGLKPWEMAAGALMVTEAGGLISDALGDKHYLKTGHLIAGCPKIFSQLLPRIGTNLSTIHPLIDSIDDTHLSESTATHSTVTSL
jgi:myo-inositol-1(or 4)-monophosphatase